MKNLNEKLQKIILFMLIFLWIYTASSKLMDFRRFKAQMHNQTVPSIVSDILIYTLPAVEICTALLLLSRKTKLAGLYISSALMLLFTCYVGLVIVNYFGRVPCSCGGVLQMMNWQTHFLFNVFFLLLTVFGIYSVSRERRDLQAS